VVCLAQLVAAPVTTVLEDEVAGESAGEQEARSNEYNLRMKDAMGWGDRPFQYSYDRWTAGARL
jgi:hypothetical protein